MGKVRVYSKGKYIGIEAINKNIPRLVETVDCKSVIVNSDNFEITKKAYDLLFKTHKLDDEFGEIDCFKLGDEVNFSWDGNLALFDSDYIMGTNQCDFTLLKDFITDIDIPIEFTIVCDILIEEDLNDKKEL